ncbi:hypothetical protein Cgig2_012669 [Carnegiea gigantea]|uniref:Uncharacterized protein n=1 Tax=Carnegiea gigantea TaxID=171969 RepID=A0A9Q1GHX7_9CARY|nr:hypothetical protein Cgig2_012669 [Carnegiea gigantea]
MNCSLPGHERPAVHRPEFERRPYAATSSLLLTGSSILSLPLSPSLSSWPDLGTRKTVLCPQRWPDSSCGEVGIWARLDSARPSVVDRCIPNNNYYCPTSPDSIIPENPPCPRPNEAQSQPVCKRRCSADHDTNVMSSSSSSRLLDLCKEVELMFSACL